MASLGFKHELALTGGTSFFGSTTVIALNGSTFRIGFSANVAFVWGKAAIDFIGQFALTGGISLIGFNHDIALGWGHRDTRFHLAGRPYLNALEQRRKFR
jgi:hypothetical protein